MKMLFNITRVELQMLFYSPVAWLLLIIFTVQSSLFFTDIFNVWVTNTELGYPLIDLSMRTFTGGVGLLGRLRGYIYFYIPLLTMGIVSKELSSGSIRLLYSSPLTNFQIIVGKYLSLMIYGALMMSVTLVYVFYSYFTIENFELGAILTGVLGLYLLICAYAAIGIFMSSLTSYQIVAAIGTLAVLMLLQMVNRYGQEYNIIRDITWWLAIGGKVESFLTGLICTKELLYFLIVIVLFIALTVVRLNAVRQKTRFSVTLGKNLIIIVTACVLGYFSSRPVFMYYFDTTHTKRNTLTPNSQDIIARLKGGVTITTYINILGESPGLAHPGFLNPDRERFRQYLQFKPEIKLKYVYYYEDAGNAWLEHQYPGKSDRERMVELCKVYKIDTSGFLTPKEIKARIDLSAEGNSFVRQIVRDNGEKTWLRVYNDVQRYPHESEITAAFKKLVMDLPVVGFLQGHNERSNTQIGDRNYTMFANVKTFRHSLQNQGFEVATVHLDKAVPENINILVIADMFQGFTPEEEKNMQEYIDRGGNLFILGEPRRREVMNPLFNRFGFSMAPGILVKNDTTRLPDLIRSVSTPEAAEISYHFENPIGLGTPTVAGLEMVEDKGFKVTTMFRTDSEEVWNEVETKYFTDEDTVVYNPGVGEVKKSYATVVALSREINGREQRIMLSGDADCISNVMGDARIPHTWNYTLIQGAFWWLSDYEVPIDIRRPPLRDNDIYIGKTGFKVMKTSLLYGMPILFFILAIFVWLRRRTR